MTNEIRTTALNASVALFSLPQFSNQVTPQNVLGLADLFANYIAGGIQVTQPSEQPTAPAPEAPVFG